MKPWTAASIWLRAMPMSLQRAVVEFAQGCDGGAADEVAGDGVPAGGANPGDAWRAALRLRAGRS